MAGILVIGEVVSSAVTRQSLETTALARKLAADLNQPISGALLGVGDLSGAATQFQCSFSSLLLAENPQLSGSLTQPMVAAAEVVIKKSAASIVLLPHSPTTRDWAPQLATKLSAALVLDCSNIEAGSDGLAVSKPMYGGGVLGTISVPATPAVFTVRPGIFQPATSTAGGNVERVDVGTLPMSSRIHHLESVALETGTGPKLKDAKSVVCGGRGTGSRDNWRYIEECAAAMGASVGCSRPIVDMGWLKWNHQVGLSGTQVSPDLYIAVGISGAVQHLAGIANAKTVVAINTDADAEIFERADYGVIGDFKEVLTAFTERVKELRK